MKVAIADDHQLILGCITDLISQVPYMTLCGSYLSGAALREGLKQVVPDILILDNQLQDETGLQLSRFINYHYPNLKILILTGFDKPGIVSEALESGCMGVLLKSNTDTDVLVEAICRVNDGHIFIDSSLRQSALQSSDNKVSEQHVTIQLTIRETEILVEIAKGLSNIEIAAKLFISVRTVENHRNRIMLKSGSKNSVALLKFAFDRKLIEL